MKAIAKVLACAALLAAVCVPAAFAETIYTACNMWYENPLHMYSINYKKGAMIPAGTEVRDVAIGKGARGTLRGRTIIMFTTVEDNQEHTIEFQKKYHPRMKPEDIAGKLFTQETFGQLTREMTDAEVKAIKEGKLVVGMSKAAVLVAYGYPPTHRTRDLSGNRWTYWIDRRRQKNVYFDENGRTQKAPSTEQDEL